MQRFENILFINEPATSSEQAIRRAINLARSNEAKLTITNIRKKIPHTLSQYQKPLKQEQKDTLYALIEEENTKGVDINVLPLTGTPFLEIIKEVLRSDIDLVIKPAEGSETMSSMLFGSTDMHLLRKCPCPVWIIKPTKQKQFSRILAPIDPDPEEKTNAELNKLILDLATSLAYRENSELHIVHAWYMMYESTLRNRGSRTHLSNQQINDMVYNVSQNHKKWLDDTLAQYDLQNLSVKIHLLKGEPGDVITSLAKKEEVDLIVMGTIARTGIPGFFIGNTAEKIIEDADCSVLAVKPNSFSTPVET